MKKIIGELISTLVIATIDAFVVNYLNSKEMNEIMWVSVFLSILFILLVWSVGYLLRKIDKQNDALSKFYKYYEDRHSYTIESLNSHLEFIYSALEGIIDSTNAISIEIVNKNMKNTELKPPIMTVNVKKDDRIIMFANHIKSNLEKFRDEFENALNA